VKKMAQKQKKYEKEVQGTGGGSGQGNRCRKGGEGTGYSCGHAVREGRLEAGPGSSPPGDAMSFAEELAVLRKQNKALEREIRRLKEENAFLAEANAFFAASRRKSAKNSE